MKPWWEEWPGLLEYEQSRLDHHGIRYELDEAAFSRGVVSMSLWFIHEDKSETKLIATFPDNYPYFRCEVSAPELALKYHQHPVGHNLCLMGRATHNWNTTDTLGDVLVNQLPSVISTANAKSEEDYVGQEEEQAEPYTDYYPYAPSMFLVEKEWSIPVVEKNGILKIAVNADLKDDILGGAILEVQSPNGRVLAKASAALHCAYSNRRIIYGKWARSSEPIAEFNQDKFIKKVESLGAANLTNVPHSYGGRLYRVWGLLFPVEIAHRTTGEGWVFACVDEPDPSNKSAALLSVKKQGPSRKSRPPRRKKKR